MNRPALVLCVLVFGEIGFIPTTVTADGVILKAQVCTRTAPADRRFPVVISYHSGFIVHTTDESGQFVMSLEVPGPYEIRLPNLLRPVAQLELIADRRLYALKGNNTVAVDTNEQLFNAHELKLEIKLLPNGRDFHLDAASIGADEKRICSSVSEGAAEFRPGTKDQ